MDKATLRWKLIEEFLQAHSYIMNADVRELWGASAATSNRVPGGFVREEKLIQCREVGMGCMK